MPSRRRRSRSTGRAVVALVLLLAGCAGDDDAPPPPESSAADAPLRVPTTLPAPRPFLRPASEAAALGGPGDQRLVAAAAGPGAVVAVGGDGGRAAVWRSTDLHEWGRVALPPDEFPADAVLADVVAGGPGFVAVGAVGGVAAAWLSPDGEAWARGRVDEGPPITAVAETAWGLVAFGGGEDADTASWRSVDGARWLRALDDPDVFARPGPERVVGVVEAARRLVALVERGEQGPEVWASDGSGTWEVGPFVGNALLPAADGRSVAGDLLAAGSTLVAGGSVVARDGVDAALWVSTGGRGWDRVEHDEDLFGGDGDQEVVALEQGGSELVAVGTEVVPGHGARAVVWASADGSDWRRSDPSAGSGDAAEHPADTASAGEAVVVVGWVSGPGGEDGRVWLVDGREPPPAEEVDGPVLAWERVPAQPDLTGPGEREMTAVVATEEGFLAAGAARDEEAAALDAALWRSGDGRGWARVTDHDGALGGTGDQRVLGLAVLSDGTVVATGVDDGSAAAWRSGDGGRRWERASVAADEGPSPQPGAMAAVAVGSPGLVAVGWRGDQATTWRSPDGLVWERGEADVDPPGAGAMQAVAWDGGAFVALGRDGDRAIAWRSPDGAAWSRHDLGPGAGAGVAAGLGGAVVGVGARPGGGDDLDATGWRRQGEAWETTGEDALGGEASLALTGVAATDELAVGVGWTDAGGGDDAAAWASADGVAWVRTPHDEDVFGGDLGQRMAAVAVGDEIAVAVGGSGGDAAVWIAPLAGGGAASSPL